MEQHANDNDVWLVEQVAQQRVVDGRTHTGGDRLVITAQILRDLVLGAGRPNGLRLSGLKVLDALDLAYAEIKGPITITDSEFTDDIDLRYAACASLDLHGTSLHGLTCLGTRFEHDLVLEEIDADEVVLADAQVGGSVRMRSATLQGRDRSAMIADRIRIAGAMTCRFLAATGEVRLLAAEIGDLLDLSSGRFENAGEYSLVVDDIRVRGDLVGRAIDASGAVRLGNVVIGGQLDLRASRFRNPDGIALFANGLQVAGSVTLRDGTAVGVTRLFGAVVGGSLDLCGHFSNPDGIALSIDRSRIRGGVSCESGFEAVGEVSLAGATIEGRLIISGGTFDNPSGLALNASGADIGTFAFVRSGNTSSGGISLSRAHIGDLDDRVSAWQPFSFVNMLYLTYDRINVHSWTTRERLSWLRRLSVYQSESYEQLATTLRTYGHEREARRIQIAKHAQQRRQERWYTRFPGLLFGGVLGYGYRPLQRTVPLLAALYIIGAFWLLPQARDHQAVVAIRVPVHATTAAAPVAGGQSPQPIVATKHCPSDYPCFSSWAYTLDVLVPLVNTHQTDYWTIISKHGDRGTIWYIRLAPTLGWILSTAAALGFTGLIRRD